LNRFAVVATHHKTGTVWMRTVFQRIASSIGVPFINIKAVRPSELRAMSAPAILFNDHSKFNKIRWMLANDAFRILHLIRDPRDVVVSAMHYHLRATEKWLHVQRKSFSGMSYQQALNNLDDDHSRYLFEMENSAGRVIRDMGKWDYLLSNSLECKYETLILDSDRSVFRRIIGHLGFADDEVDECLRLFWKHSLFGELGEQAKTAKSKHIRSGEVTQWKKVFDRDMAASFLDKFGNVLIKLDYERDNSWVDGLRVVRADE
jgi:hypothetical protein